MRIGRSSTASWRQLAASGLAATVLAAPLPPAVAFNVARGSDAALACEPAGLPALAQQADLVFAGTVERRWQDGREPASWARPFVDRWPNWLPVPEQQAPGRALPAVTMRVTALYKGTLDGPEATVRLYGRARIGSGPWTVFANRADALAFFTTECSGNTAGAIDPAAYALPPGRPVAATAWWTALWLPLMGLLAALALGAAAVAAVARVLRRRG